VKNTEYFGLFPDKNGILWVFMHSDDAKSQHLPRFCQKRQVFDSLDFASSSKLQFFFFFLFRGKIEIFE